MRVMIRELVMKPGYTHKDLIIAAAGRLRCGQGNAHLVRILRQSFDARACRRQPSQIVNAIFDIPDSTELDGLKNVEPTTLGKKVGVWAAPARGAGNGKSAAARPVVVGAGPAGLFAAYTLALAGRAPLLLEQGRPVSERRKAVGAFWGKGILDPRDNVLCGEGGAGAFSDGKLTSRSKDQEGKEFVLARLIDCGAPESVLFDSDAHLGSDALAEIIPALRGQIVALGGEVRFGARVERFLTENGRLRGLTLDRGEVACESCILATGHSARQMYRALAEAGANLEAKGFALGVRVELPQELVNRSQLGKFAGHPAVGPASFRLTHQGRCHTFCMCPGGAVIACADDPGLLCTNGMSLSTRSGHFANAAFLLPLPPLEAGSVLAGLDYLGGIEAKAFAAGGSDYSLPATTLAGFSGGAAALPDSRSCLRARLADFHDFLPEEIYRGLSEALPSMLRSLGNPRAEEVILYGPETRSTTPVRIVRDTQKYECSGLSGLYPAGEGAGYAGGIISSAIDGFRAAEALLVAERTE